MNPYKYSVRQLEQKAVEIRMDLIRALAQAGSGHSGGPLGLADMVTAVYFWGVDIDPKHPDWQDRDRIVFSAGHYSPLIYSALAHAGYFSVDHFVNDYRQFGGGLDGHPNLKTPGIENASGPLGQGVSIAAGMAAALELNNSKSKVWLFMSDGEQQEGQTQEAIWWIGHRKLNNIIAILDVNNMQIDGKVSNVMPEPWLYARYKQLGWQVIGVDGNNMKKALAAIGKALHLSSRVKKPVIILAHTTPGKGVSYMEGDYRWHGKPPKGEEVDRALEELEKRAKRLGVKVR